MTEYLGDILNDRDGQVILIQNKASTTSKKFDSKIADTINFFHDDPKLRHRLLVLYSEGNLPTTEQIEEALHPGCIVAAIGGDGTVSSLARPIMWHPDREVRETPLLACGGGNSNLAAKDLFSNQLGKISIHESLARGEIVKVRPTLTTIYNPLDNTPTLETAFFVSGVGFSASVANRLEKDRFIPLRRISPSRFCVDAYSTIRGALNQNHEPIQLSVNGQEYESAAGIISATVSEYAKVAKTNTSIETAGINSLIIPKATFIGELIIAYGAIAHRADWIETNENEVLEIGLHTKPNQKIYYEIDAEPKELKTDPKEGLLIRITQAVSPQALNMIRVKELN